jgi:hypothetical protein
MPIGVRIGGRQKGTPNKRTAAMKEALAAVSDEGLSPLEVMVKVMRHFLEMAENTKDPIERAVYMEKASEHAAKAAPYMHPKLASVEVGGRGGQPIQIIISPKDERL